MATLKNLVLSAWYAALGLFVLGLIGIAILVGLDAFMNSEFMRDLLTLDLSDSLK